MQFLASLLVALRFAAGVLSAADLLMIEELMVQEEQDQAVAAGFTVDVVTTAQFNALTTQDFSAYKALVFGDRYCNGDIRSLDFLEVNKDVWSSAITGNMALLAHDATWAVYSSQAGASLMPNSFRFAAGQEGATGLYMTMSCYGYSDDGTETPITALSYFGNFNVAHTDNRNAHIVASSPISGTLTDTDISDNNFFQVQMFTAYPKGGAKPFLPLAIISGETGPGSMTFADGTTGVPFILARGEALLPATTTSSSSSSSTTESSTMESSTTEASTTESSTTEASTTEASTTEASTTEASTTEASTTESSTTEASTTESSIIESTTADSTTSESSAPGSSTTTTLSMDSSSLTSISSLITEVSSAPELSTTMRFANTTSAATFSSGTSETSPVASDSASVPQYFTGRGTSTTSAFDTRTSNLATSSSADTSGLSSSTGSISESGISNTSSTISLSSSIPSLISTNSFTAQPSTSSFNSSATALGSPSSTGTLPSTTATNPNIRITFIIQIVFTARIKRQLATSFAVIDSAGIVESTPFCQQSSFFNINAQGQLTSNSLTARALPAGIASGSEPFTFALPVAGQVDTTFFTSGSQLLWNNNAFANGNAIFALNPVSRLIEVFYSRAPPSNYQTLVFNIIPATNVADACAALAVPVIPTTTPGTTAPVPTTTPPSSLNPVGFEVVVYVTIRTVIVGGETVCLTNPTSTKTNMIYRSAVPGSPCYPCLLASDKNFEFPNEPESKCTVVTSSCTGPNSALFTAPSAVYKPCSTCVATTLPGAAITPGAPGIEKSAGFSPVKTITVGGGEVIYGSMSVSGQVIPTAVAMPVPGNAPQVPGGQNTQAAAPAPYAPPNANVNTKAADAPPVNVNTKPADAPPVNVNTKAAEATPSQGPPPNVGTKTPEAPPDATQSIKTVVTAAAASVVGDLTFVYFIFLGIFII